VVYTRNFGLDTEQVMSELVLAQHGAHPRRQSRWKENQSPSQPMPTTNATGSRAFARAFRRPIRSHCSACTGSSRFLVLAGVFVVSWLVALIVWRSGKIEERWSRNLAG
jgi:hypothetical protein